MSNHSVKRRVRQVSNAELVGHPAALADAFTGTLLTQVGLSSLKPLPCSQTLVIFGYALASCLVVNDAVKVAMIKWRVPAAVA